MMTAMPSRARPFCRSPLFAAALGAALGAAALAGCSKDGGGSVTSTPSSPRSRSPLTFTAEEGGLGYLALAPEVSDATNPYWLPHGDAPVVLLAADDPSMAPKPPAAGSEVRAVPALGPALRLKVGAPANVPYGCDGGSITEVALAPVPGAPAPAPGVLWVLPSSPDAAGWQPSGIEVAVRELSPEKRTWRVGQLDIALAVKDRNHARFAASAGQTWVMSRELERPMMEGAEDVPIDLTQDVPGMPSIAAAYSFTPPAGPTGPLLLVVATPAYEGVQLSTLFYDGTTLSEVPSLRRYLYLCAF